MLRTLAEAMERPTAPDLFAWCLMPNHWHLLLRPRANGDLSKWMQWLTVTHTHRWHAHRHTSGNGSLYHGRFKSFPSLDDGHFLTVACHDKMVERNPLRAGLVRPRDGADAWRWGSASVRRRGPGPLREILSEWPVNRPRDWAILTPFPFRRCTTCAARSSRDEMARGRRTSHHRAS